MTTPHDLGRKVRWGWMVVAVLLAAAAVVTGLLEQCGQTGTGEPVCTRSLPPVVPLSLGALAVAAVVVGVRRHPHD